LTGAIATGGAATISFAQTEEQQQGGDTTGQQGGQQGGQERIVQQGTVTSAPEPTPGHEGHQYATVLPLRQDGSVYTGVLTYTASVPVEVVVLNVQTLNETERAVLNATDDDGFGTLLTTPLDNETSIAISVITPPYGDTPIPSASIPITGNALWLHTLDGTPFVANYAVSAQVVPAETVNVISNATLAGTAEEAAEEADAEEADAEDGDAADEGADAEDAEDAEGEEGEEGEEGGAGGAGAPA
ncbi:MAG: hypothetical protein M3M86_02495, partial [Thermoproteota archaeon]|nr:hypothetical protein [Thermoproteota archaeon]